MSLDVDNFAEIERQAADEGFYKNPTGSIDYCDWAIEPTWSAEQAVALMSGLDPDGVDWQAIGTLKGDRPLAGKLWRQRERMNRAYFAGEYPLPIPPHRLLDWIEVRQFDVPRELTDALRKFGRPMPDWGDICRKLKQEVEELRHENEEQKLQLHELRQLADAKPEAKETRELTENKEDELNPRVMDTFLKLLLGIAIVKFGFDPLKPGYSHTPTAIAAALRKVGLSIDEGTVLKWLRSAVKRFPEVKAIVKGRL